MINEMTMGSLFDGVAMFPLAAERNGIKAVWASEIEKFPMAVSRLRFPDMKHLGDIKDIGLCTYITHFKGTKCNFYINTSKDVLVKPVDIITFGSPCQDLSVAGKREGMAGERSGLFSQAIRIIREMRFVTNGEYPRYAIWENVPGTFSSNSGQDFRTVLEEITAAEIPMPKSGKWAKAGMVRGNGHSVAWRTLDAQYWGVAQRRKRIFLVADFRGQRAGEILFERESMSGDFETSGETRKEVAGSVGNGIETTILFEPRSQDGVPRIHESGICPTLNTAQGGQRQPCIAQPMAYSFDALGSNSMKSSNPHSGGRFIDTCYCLDTSVPEPSKNQGGIAILEPKAYVIQSATMSGDKKQNGLGVSDGPCYTLDCRADHAVAYGIRNAPKPNIGTICASGAGTNRPAGQGNETDLVICYPEPANALLAKGNLSYRADVDNLVCAVDVRNLYETEELSGTLQSKNTGGYSLNYQNPVRVGYAVRRLLPIETERLMAMPDGWTNIPGASDTARYKAIGNSLVMLIPDWIFSQIVKLHVN